VRLRVRVLRPPGLPLRRPRGRRQPPPDGEKLAEEAPVEADVVIPVPDSGMMAAVGYSQASGIPYAEGLIKNRYVGRTFIQPTDGMRQVGCA
jgi:glutamine phosphoribosylpyrophosphate amidotransferase